MNYLLTSSPTLRNSFSQRICAPEHVGSSEDVAKSKLHFKQTMNAHFPSSLPMHDYLRFSYKLLRPLGFCKTNSLACVSVCRDELTEPLMTAIQKQWSNIFSFSGLAGMMFMGKTGFLAAHQHAPHVGAVRRQVFFVFPHIGIASHGEVGLCERREGEPLSPACGALMALQQEMANHGPIPSFDPLDPEQSFIRQRLSNMEIDEGVPDLVTLTKRAYVHIVKDLENLISTLLDQDTTHYAVFSGIQIHGPVRKCYIWPGSSYCVTNNQRHKLSFPSHQ